MGIADMLIHGRGCLGAAVAIIPMEIQGGNSVFAQCAQELDGALHGFSSVIFHGSIVERVHFDRNKKLTLSRPKKEHQTTLWCRVHTAIELKNH